MESGTETTPAPQPGEWESIADILQWADHAADVGNIYIAVDLRRVLSRHVVALVPAQLTKGEARERANVRVLNGPVAPVGPMVTWDEPQLPNRPMSSHALLVRPYFDRQRNNEVAKVIAAALTPPTQSGEGG